MVKKCAWGLCNSDSRYPERLADGVRFIPFPKPRRSHEKCMRWIKLCGRPHEQLNVSKVDRNRHLFVCTKHFVDGEPSEAFPDPLPATSGASHTRRRPHTKMRLSTEPHQKRSRKTLVATRCTVGVDKVLKMELPTSSKTPGFRVKIWSEGTTLQFPNIDVLCRWSRVGVLEHLSTDTEIALFLLKRYEDTLNGILSPIRCSACRKSMELRITTAKCSSCLQNFTTGDSVPTLLATLLATDVAQKENTGSTVNIGYTENAGHERQAKDARVAEQTDNCNTSCSEKADSHSAQPLDPVVHAATNIVNIPQGLECIKTEPLSETEVRPYTFHPEIREDKLCTPPPVESTNTDDLPDVNSVHAFTGNFNSAHGCMHNGIKTEAEIELQSNISDFAATELHRDCASEKEFYAYCVSDSTSLEYTGNVNLPVHAATNTVYTARGCTSKGVKMEVVSHYQTDEADFHGDNDKQNTTVFSNKRLCSPDTSIFCTQTDFIKQEKADDSETERETSDFDAKTKHRDSASSVSQPQITHLAHEHGENVSTVSQPQITHTMQNENIVSVSSNSAVSQPQITRIIPNQHYWNMSRPQVMYLAQNIHINAGEGDAGTTPQLQFVCIAPNVFQLARVHL